ncbi:helix-turn-helix transcriptional regulator [Heyndrickxia ginsengihumi]|uniref:helix-turn-helix domain-containing protein n=1 Tax=Heyndrickxia ginsengihumi TaxID=363870 RepID=UPI003D236158
MVNEEVIELALNDFGAYVKETRLQLGMSLHELADKTSLSASFIYRLEVGQRSALLNTRLVILLYGFNWDKYEIMIYFGRILKDLEDFKKVIK